MTEMGFVMAGGLLVLIPAAMMMLYSSWNLRMAQRVVQDWQERLHKLMETEKSVLDSESELRSVLRAQVERLDALDKSVGHIFGQVMSQTANRTVLRKDRQIGEEMPPFPGASPEWANQSRVFPNQETVATGFVNPSESRRRDSALGEPS